MTTIKVEVIGHQNTAEVIAGIDTHADTHHVAVIDPRVRQLGGAGFPATSAGYHAILDYLIAFGVVIMSRCGASRTPARPAAPVRAVDHAVPVEFAHDRGDAARAMRRWCRSAYGFSALKEPTHSYSAGSCCTCNKPGCEWSRDCAPADRSDACAASRTPIDAYEAAATELAGITHSEPKALDGAIETVRYLHAARRSVVKARSAARVQVKSLLVTAPDRIRRRSRDMGDSELL